MLCILTITLVLNAYAKEKLNIYKTFFHFSYLPKKFMA